MRCPHGFALTLAAVAGCYSPSYTDCEVSCSAGACPSGLVCDPQMAKCRPPGANGACNASGNDDANTTTDSLNSDVQVLTFCDGITDTNVIFCEDFDAEPLDQQGWSATSELGSGMLSLVPSIQSAPNALQSAATANSAGATETAQVSRIVQVPTSFNSFHLAFYLYVASRESPADDTAIVRIDTGTGPRIELVSQGIDQGAYQTNGINQTYITIPLTTWIHVTINVVHSSSLISISATHDVNGSTTTYQVVDNISYSNTSADWNVHVGATTTTLNGAMLFHYDNVVIKLQ